MRVLIVGCGYVGTALAKLLDADGHIVFGLRRRIDELPAGIRPIAGDVSNPDTLKALPAGIDAVVYAAAAGRFDEARYRAAYVEGPRNVIRALADANQPVRRFLYVSSTGVYAQENGEWVDETSPAEQTHFTGAAMLEGERLVGSAPFSSVIVRFAGIYGPGRTRIIDSVRDGSAVCPVSPTYLNLIHRDDCAGFLRHLISLNHPCDLYLGVDSEPIERGELLRWIAGKLGLPPPPSGPVDLSVRAARGNKRCRNRRLIESGYALRFPTYRDGYSSLL
jgi:nucleoside-diphosphate-sugar epimerase